MLKVIKAERTYGREALPLALRRRATCRGKLDEDDEESSATPERQKTSPENWPDHIKRMRDMFSASPGSLSGSYLKSTASLLNHFPIKLFRIVHYSISPPPFTHLWHPSGPPFQRPRPGPARSTAHERHPGRPLPMELHHLAESGRNLPRRLVPPPPSAPKTGQCPTPGNDSRGLKTFSEGFSPLWRINRWFKLTINQTL